jgi:hypothetical protein
MVFAAIRWIEISILKYTDKKGGPARPAEAGERRPLFFRQRIRRGDAYWKSGA